MSFYIVWLSVGHVLVFLFLALVFVGCERAIRRKCTHSSKRMNVSARHIA